MKHIAIVGAGISGLAAAYFLSKRHRVWLYHAENIGAHYARTLHAWRERFNGRLDEVRACGFDDRFIRMWDLYLAYCEAAFLERHAGDFQLLLVKNGTPRALFNEPWEAIGDDVSKAVASGF